MEKINSDTHEYNIENPLRDIYLKHANRIRELQEAKNIEDLQKTLNHVINLLPRNVTSFSIPIYDDNENATFVRSERESTLPKEEQTEWGIGDLIEYSININSKENYNPVD